MSAVPVTNGMHGPLFSKMVCPCVTVTPSRIPVLTLLGRSQLNHLLGANIGIRSGANGGSLVFLFASRRLYANR